MLTKRKNPRKRGDSNGQIKSRTECDCKESCIDAEATKRWEKGRVDTQEKGGCKKSSFDAAEQV